jgi:hyaluronate lyase
VPRVIPVLLATALASGGCALAPGVDSGAKAGPVASSAVESGSNDTGQDAIDVSEANAPGDTEPDGPGGQGWDVAGGDSSAPSDAGGDSSSPPDAPGDSSSPPDAPGDSSAPPEAPGDSSALPDAGGDSSALPDAAADAGGLATTDQTPTKDAYLRDGTYATTNFGSDVTLAVKNASDGVPGFSRRTWLTFDVSHFTSIRAAKLRLFLNSLDTTDTNVLLANVFSTPASSNGWGELTITWNNAPTIGQQIASSMVDSPNVGTWVEWDVTSVVQTEIGGMSTLVIEGGLGSLRLALFSSREGVHPPVLRITGN